MQGSGQVWHFLRVSVYWLGEHLSEHLPSRVRRRDEEQEVQVEYEEQVVQVEGQFEQMFV